ncbi:hypothetical protein [Mycobacterium palustre]|uniref:Uncharacterized protein n=1 Tax=Mycobacterium palustre TaxID=153971 RepID=A0A1X1ZVP7_9MYCO|nr:hypothetical protein [Mycobacterium palustre]MCV7101542.1 hypothetical protein [Mycobacterium palustre]ORW28185.1 hypothetical protein AWC19_27505 [Mycobacterium palustre]
MAADDGSPGIRALINQIPHTMLASHVILNQLASTSGVAGEDQQLTLENLNAVVVNLKALLADCVITLDDKIEKLAGRPGIPDGLIAAVLSEFHQQGR